jgi:Replication-relaxation
MLDPGSSPPPRAPLPETAATQPNVRPPRLQRPDRELLALLGVCRYLTAGQVASLRLGGRTEKGAVHRLRRLSGDAPSKGWPFSPALVRALAYRAFDGEPLRLWGLTPAGCSVAAGELGRVLKSFRSDVGAVFAEHFVFLTELFVRLARPHLAAGVLPRALPFRWNVAEDVELPWRDRDEAGCEKSRVIRPDAVLELPGCERRLFIECEMGTNPLTASGPDKPQATVRKIERYDAYVSGFADVTARLSHYRRKYPDGWPCEVLFLVQSESRRRATSAALAACLETLAGSRLCARALTLEEAVAHCAGFLRRPETPVAPSASPLAPAVGSEAPFYGEREHSAVKDFVLDMTAALAEANAQLRGHGLAAIPGPASKAPMLDFLRKAQTEMQRRRRSA